jgi:hypothetical protein
VSHSATFTYNICNASITSGACQTY